MKRNIAIVAGGDSSEHDVSLRSVKQEGTHERGAVDLIFVTHTACEKNIRAVLDDLREMKDMILADPPVIRVED